MKGRELKSWNEKIIEIARQLKCSLVPWSGNLPSFIDKIWFVIVKQCSLVSLFILLHCYLMMSICQISVVHYFLFHNFFLFSAYRFFIYAKMIIYIFLDMLYVFLLYMLYIFLLYAYSVISIYLLNAQYFYTYFTYWPHIFFHRQFLCICRGKCNIIYGN